MSKRAKVSLKKEKEKEIPSSQRILEEYRPPRTRAETKKEEEKKELDKKEDKKCLTDREILVFLQEQLDIIREDIKLLFKEVHIQKEPLAKLLELALRVEEEGSSEDK